MKHSFCVMIALKKPTGKPIYSNK